MAFGLLPVLTVINETVVNLHVEVFCRYTFSFLLCTHPVVKWLAYRVEVYLLKQLQKCLLNWFCHFTFTAAMYESPCCTRAHHANVWHSTVKQRLTSLMINYAQQRFIYLPMIHIFLWSFFSNIWIHWLITVEYPLPKKCLRLVFFFF